MVKWVKFIVVNGYFSNVSFQVWVTWCPSALRPHLSCRCRFRCRLSDGLNDGLGNLLPLWGWTLKGSHGSPVSNKTCWIPCWKLGPLKVLETWMGGVSQHFAGKLILLPTSCWFFTGISWPLQGQLSCTSAGIASCFMPSLRLAVNRLGPLHWSSTGSSSVRLTDVMPFGHAVVTGHRGSK